MSNTYSEKFIERGEFSVAMRKCNFGHILETFVNSGLRNQLVRSHKNFENEPKIAFFHCYRKFTIKPEDDNKLKLVIMIYFECENEMSTRETYNFLQECFILTNC